MALRRCIDWVQIIVSEGEILRGERVAHCNFLCHHLQYNTVLCPVVSLVLHSEFVAYFAWSFFACVDV